LYYGLASLDVFTEQSDKVFLLNKHAEKLLSATDNKLKHFIAYLSDINMFVTLTATERSLPQFQKLLKEAGFKFTQKLDTRTVFSIIEAEVLS
jgi:hypothetical protein